MAVFRCGGYRRTDPETDKPLCDFKSTRRWHGRCPKCKGPWDCLKQGTDGSKRKLASAAEANDPDLQVKHIPTGEEGIDYLTAGGVVESQLILLAGGSGTRKTSTMLRVLNGLTKQTTRPLLFASAEMNTVDLKLFCQTMKVTDEQVKLMGDVVNIYDVLNVCDEIRPLVLVVDSLQAVSKNSSQPDETIAHVLMQYCKRTKMCAVIINHVTSTLAIKGGTGAPHYVDTILFYEPFIPKMDGHPRDMFGRQALDAAGIVVGSDREQPVDNLRVLVVFMKNRYGGGVGKKVYYATTPDGDIVQLKLLPEEPMPPIREIRRGRRAGSLY